MTPSQERPLVEGRGRGGDDDDEEEDDEEKEEQEEQGSKHQHIATRRLEKNEGWYYTFLKSDASQGQWHASKGGILFFVIHKNGNCSSEL